MTSLLHDPRSYCPSGLGPEKALGAACPPGWEALVGTAMLPPLASATSAQVGILSFHVKDLLLCKSGQQRLVGMADGFIRDAIGHHVVLVWEYTHKLTKHGLLRLLIRF